MFKFFSFIKEFESVENILWLRLIFVKEFFWFFKRKEGRKVNLFLEILSLVKCFRFLNNLLEIKLLVKFKLILIVCNCWRFFMFWNILGWMFVKLFFDKLRKDSDGKLKIFFNIRGMFVFMRYNFFMFFLKIFICKGYLWVLWIKLYE